ncbi:MAG: 2OG-Fe(II) oxygenase [bacterium]
MTSFFDFDRFDAIDAEVFSAQKPFPFVNPSHLLRPGAWEALQSELPPIGSFEAKFGKKRTGGQAPHDRYSLEYAEDLELSPSWKSFLAELRSDRYRRSICRLLGVKDVRFRFHWHYTPSGRSVSPHVDQLREIGSHIFYFNDPQWQERWGGQTLILESKRPLPRRSAPSVEDFDGVIDTRCVGNQSLLFRGGGHAWHAVRSVRCPEQEMRRVFIVVCNTTALSWRLRDWLIGKKSPGF